MNTPSLPVICINVEDARVRWKHIEEEVQRCLPGLPLFRIPAIHWKELSRDLSDVPMTPLTRFFVLHPDEQKHNRVSHRQMDTPSSVGIMLSHIRCWRWLVDRPQYAAALVLEDDACFDKAEWPQAVNTTLGPLMRNTKDWDVVVIGYFNEGNRQERIKVCGLPMFTTQHFFGTHSYLVTQSAARKLLSYSFPIEQQSDGFLLTMGQLGYIRLYLLDNSIVDQCMNSQDRMGGFHTGSVMSTSKLIVVRQNSTSDSALIEMNAEQALTLVFLFVVLCILLGVLMHK